MARFGINDADKYGGQGGGGYFSLKNDKDVATVRFMYDSIEDIEGFAVHEVKLNDKKRYVNCLRDYGAPVDDCPFCKAGRFVNVKYFLPLYNVDDDKVQTWERGKQFGAKLSGLCARYPHLVGHKFEIERNGKAGDMQTKYEIYPVGDSDDTRVEDLPETSEILGGLILDKSYDDMQYYVDYDEFPEDDAPTSHRGESRRESRRDDRYSSRESRHRDSEERTSRRTPARRGNAPEEDGEEEF